MSLITDSFFYQALRNSDDVTAIVSDRLFNTGRTEEDESEDRIPYIIITNEGTTNTAETKDDGCESPYDRDTISILCVGNDREELALLTQLVRSVIKAAISEQDTEDQGYEIVDYTFKASPISLDILRPCHSQTLWYACEVDNNPD